MSDKSWPEMMREKAQGSTDAPFWLAAANAFSEASRERDKLAKIGERLLADDEMSPEWHAGVSALLVATGAVTLPKAYMGEYDRMEAYRAAKERGLTVPSELLLLLGDPLMGPAIKKFVEDVKAQVEYAEQLLTAARLMVPYLTSNTPIDYIMDGEAWNRRARFIALVNAGGQSAAPQMWGEYEPTLAEKAIAYVKGQHIPAPRGIRDVHYNQGVAACVRILEDTILEAPALTECAKLLPGAERVEPPAMSAAPDPAVDVTEAVLLAYINDTPPLLSLLYDINLMPEQVDDASDEEERMFTIANHWRENAISRPAQDSPK